jgi:hypothetical protein
VVASEITKQVREGVRIPFPSKPPSVPGDIVRVNMFHKFWALVSQALNDSPHGKDFYLKKAFICIYVHTFNRFEVYYEMKIIIIKLTHITTAMFPVRPRAVELLEAARASVLMPDMPQSAVKSNDGRGLFHNMASLLGSSRAAQINTVSPSAEALRVVEEVGSALSALSFANSSMVVNENDEEEEYDEDAEARLSVQLDHAASYTTSEHDASFTNINQMNPLVKGDVGTDV